MPENTTLSACLIVRNEEKYLDDCLSSIAPLVDEIIVVDTGSSDRSPDIAGRHNARVHSIAWPHDFSAARNEALRLSGGEWILSIDADETLRPVSAPELRYTLRDPSRIACFTSLCPKAGWTEMRNVRLFRNHPGIRFSGVFHENIWPDLHRLVDEYGFRIGESSLVFDHRGFDGDQSEKHRRNVPLILKELERSPESTFHWQHLAHIYLESGKRAEAEEILEKNVARLRRRINVHPADSLSYIHLIQILLERGSDPGPRLDEALRLFPRNPQVHWLHGKFLMKAEKYLEAANCFERLIQWGVSGDFDRSISYDRRIFGMYAYEAIAVCHFRRGEYPRSRRYFEIAGKFDPDSPEYRIKGQLCSILESTAAGDSEGN